MTRHVWQEEDESSRTVVCVSCGATFTMSTAEHQAIGISLRALAQTYGVPPTCEEEEVRKIMES